MDRTRLSRTSVFQVTRRWVLFGRYRSRASCSAAVDTIDSMLGRFALRGLLSLLEEDRGRVCSPDEAEATDRVRAVPDVDSLTKYVCWRPLPLTSTFSVRFSIHLAFPASVRSFAVVSDIWMRSRMPVLSIRLAWFIVSPKSWKRAFWPRRTPPVTGPECRPIRKERSAVSGPRATSSWRLSEAIRSWQSLAKRVIATAWSSIGSGRPQTAT
mmetsp:Transcript_19791/g.46320  ORF Transcript_19791/g.46320 Transcript_19791/m.46320 type:complete len:212 (+) Transcript_19791:1636-2271(+)